MVLHHTWFFELAEYYLHPKKLGKICYGLHFRPLRSFILSLYIYYSKRPPSWFNRWFIRFARPIKSSIFDMCHLLVISPRESVFFYCFVRPVFEKGKSEEWNKTAKQEKCITTTLETNTKATETIVNSKIVIGPYFSDIFWIQV